MLGVCGVRLSTSRCQGLRNRATIRLNWQRCYEKSMAMSDRLRILLSAYACSPYRGSEHAVGWQYATNIARHHDVTVVCGDVEFEQPTKRELDIYQSQNSLPEGLRVVYVGPTPWIAMFERVHRFPLMWWCYYLAYALWQRQVLRVANQLAASERLDVVHHLNMIGFREPGFLYRLGIPFVLGPLGGANNDPAAFAKGCGSGSRLVLILRTVLNEIQKRTCVRPRRAARAAAAIFAATPAEQKMVNEIWGLSASLLPETGATPRKFFEERKPYDSSGRLRILWSGMHCQRKCLPILIDAVACEELRTSVVITVLGDGSETNAWRQHAATQGLAKIFDWRGKVSHAEAMLLMANNDVCAFTSIREGTPHVVLEALAAGVPVICHDACGMGVVVDDSCGLKIPFVDFSTSVLGFRAALIRLAREPALVRSLSHGADRRAREMSWAAKAAAMSETYRRVARDGGKKI
jgi:glycosyltransferase involved in cell wall biosynthesis